jgi:hypothetical protein
MSFATMSTLNPLKGIQIEELYDIDIEIINKPYDFSSPVKDAQRPSFMTPKPVSPKKATFVFGSNFPPPPELVRQTNCDCGSILGKRKSNFRFEDNFDDERYGQHIGADFFKSNVGHAVRPPSPNPDKWEDPDREWNEYIQKEGRRERDSESKYDPEEVMQWCFKYLAEKNIQV